MVRALLKSFARSAIALWLLAPSPAFAALGGTVASINADRVHTEGALMRMVTNDAYALHEIRAASGTMIREFVSPAGTVFAVAWAGPYMPDLQQLLGDHFGEYQAAMRARQRARRGRGSIAIDQPGLVVQMTGRARAFTGRAYVPSLVPAGIQLESIK